MPTYEYQCGDCGPFDALRALADRNTPAACPICSADSARVWLTAPGLACLPAAQSAAHAINERASHAPRQSRQETDGSYGRMRHPKGCGCCSSTKRPSATTTAADGSKTFLGKRPWMISH